MVDVWFRSDVEKVLSAHHVIVFIDESKEAKFLLATIDADIKVFQTTNEIDELKAKHEIERNTESENKYFIYTSIPKDKLKFIREYCETNGCIEIKYLDHYLKKKVNEYLNLNINIPKEELISAAKVSVGKDQTYWMDLSHKGASEIFDLEKELLPFLDDPKNYLTKFDNATQEIFFKKVSELIGKDYIQKPPQTLASEVVKSLLDGLFHNSPNTVLLSVYKTWLDSLSSRGSFRSYLDKYRLGKKSNVFEIHPSHPFQQIDDLWLEEIGKNLSDAEFISRILPKVNQRNKDKAAVSLGITYWKEVKTLLEFDEKNINQISSHIEAVTFYTKHFYKVDAAIRKLYSTFLAHPDIIEPIQEYYKNLSSVFLEKWFKFIDDYKSNQTGLIQRIIDENQGSTAIVVGDGVSWEFAQDIIAAISKNDYDLEKNMIYAGLPSETEHNMSQLYVETGEVLATKNERENYLKSNNIDKELSFIDLDTVNETTVINDYLIVSHKDPDKLGETYQQKALKYFDQVAELYGTKIKQLLQNGYKQVFLVTDHGYTLAGVLENSDKIEVSFSGTIKKNERFIRTNTQQVYDSSLLIEKSIKYNDFNYCYFSKRLGPFKSPGVYGFSHGGLTPQETLIPYFKWSSNDSNEDLVQVQITNKNDLKGVTGDLYSIKLKGTSNTTSLFSSERKVVILFFAGGKKYNESDIIAIEKGKEIKKEYHFGNQASIELVVLDSTTKEQLDKTTVTQNSARDLGGL